MLTCFWSYILHQYIWIVLFFTANKNKANHAGYFASHLGSFVHDLNALVVTGVDKMKTNTQYYTIKAIYIEKYEESLHLTTGDTPEGGIWNKWYYLTQFGIPIPKFTEIKKAMETNWSSDGEICS